MVKLVRTTVIHINRFIKHQEEEKHGENENLKINDQSHEEETIGTPF